MSVGLPGSGIGGIFYLGSALSMPFVSTARALRERSRPRLRLAFRQMLLALGIIAVLFVTGWALGHLIAATAAAHVALGHAATGDTGGASIPRVFKAATFALTFGTLGVVLFSVQVLRFFFAPAIVAAVPTAEPEPEEREAA